MCSRGPKLPLSVTWSAQPKIEFAAKPNRCGFSVGNTHQLRGTGATGGHFSQAGHRIHLRKTLLNWEPPLRNRTVDLLLTIDNQHVPVTNSAALNWPFASPRELAPAMATTRKLGFAP